MTPALRLAISLVLSLLLWLPTVAGALAASEDPAWIAGRYLLSLLVARLGVGLVFRIINGYAVDLPDVEQPQPEEAVEPDITNVDFGRRSVDAERPLPSEEQALDDALDDAAAQAALVS